MEYDWLPQRRGFIRRTLRAGKCDVVMSVPSHFELAQPTRPYYRSSYVFVYRADAPWRVRSFDDPVLKKLRIGVHLVGDDYANPPPAYALGRRGLAGNVVGYSLYRHREEGGAIAAIVHDVESRRLDLAVVWGPMAGYFARRSPVPLRVVPVSPREDGAAGPDGLRHLAGRGARRQRGPRRLESALARQRPQIRRILASYGVPLLPLGAEAGAQP